LAKSLVYLKTSSIGRAAVILSSKRIIYPSLLRKKDNPKLLNSIAFLEVVSKPQISFEIKARVFEKTQHIGHM
jgi:hypothetical protein